ncbi:MAG TPA: prolyl oligopeptidase family serine peptidase [Tepidisphaeraceae bacterium]|nr:prolyl oligopeptidase family serine peptidase [Tepidisphaeraceae bacterium]
MKPGDWRHRKWTLLCGIAMLLLACGCQANGVIKSTANFPKDTGFSQHWVAVDGQVHSFWVFVPKDYTTHKNYPAIVFLHGLFEAGDDNSNKCLAGGLAPVIAKHPEKWPFVTIFPQSTGTWRGDDRDHLAIASLDFAKNHWSIDQDRVILAGLSYGGLGTWQIGSNHPDRFAALVPISGHRDIQAVKHLLGTPVWAFDFHGDPFVPSENSEQMCEQIKSGGGSARLTEFDGVGHDCWDRALKQSDLIQWMLQQHRQTQPTKRASDLAIATVND